MIMVYGNQIPYQENIILKDEVNLKRFCFFDAGVGRLRVKINKNTFFSDEKVVAQVVASNKDSKKEIDRVTFSLVSKLKFNFGQGDCLANFFEEERTLLEWDDPTGQEPGEDKTDPYHMLLMLNCHQNDVSEVKKEKIGFTKWEKSYWSPEEHFLL